MTFDFGVANIPSHTSALPQYTFQQDQKLTISVTHGEEMEQLKLFKNLKMPVSNGHFFYINIYNTETKHKYDPKGS